MDLWPTSHKQFLLLLSTCILLGQVNSFRVPLRGHGFRNTTSKDSLTDHVPCVVDDDWINYSGNYVQLDQNGCVVHVTFDMCASGILYPQWNCGSDDLVYNPVADECVFIHDNPGCIRWVPDIDPVTGCPYYMPRFPGNIYLNVATQARDDCKTFTRCPRTGSDPSVNPIYGGSCSEGYFFNPYKFACDWNINKSLYCNE